MNYIKELSKKTKNYIKDFISCHMTIIDTQNPLFIQKLKDGVKIPEPKPLNQNNLQSSSYQQSPSQSIQQQPQPYIPGI